MALLQRTLDQTTEQIRIMRSRRYTLEKDLTDKFSALDIDQDCRELRDDHPELTFKSGAAKIESKYVKSFLFIYVFNWNWVQSDYMILSRIFKQEQTNFVLIETNCPHV